jgi:hypothetical protein
MNRNKSKNGIPVYSGPTTIKNKHNLQKTKRQQCDAFLSREARPYV